MTNATNENPHLARTPTQGRRAAGVVGYPNAAALLTVGRITLAAAALGLGVLGIIFGDFALQWQPVPEDAPARTQLAYGAAVAFAVVGMCLLAPRLHTIGALGFSFLALSSAFVLQGPEAVAEPRSIATWLGVAENLAIACGALMLAMAISIGGFSPGWTAFATRLLFGVCLPVFGLSHFAYAKFTADMIPAFIPFHLFWAYATGVGHVAAGLSILSGVLARLGSLLFACMVSSFIILLHVPRVIGDPTSRLEWTMLAMSAAITGAAWCAAGSIASRAR
jgi:uncharacterized membrane protein YphA (DoxX/SURF4 family)